MKRLTLFALSGLIGLLASCSGGSGSNEGSTQEPATESTAPQAAPSAELTQKMDAGKTVYTSYCLACHQADGNGVTGAFPTLHQTEWVLGDKTKLISVVINGLSGPIEVKGEQYNSAMPPHGFLTDQQIADVLTYVRNSFGNDADAVNAEEVAEVRQQIDSESSSN